MKHTYSMQGTVLQTPEGKFLRRTRSDWGPDFMPGPLNEAEVFTSSWAIQDAMRAWGGDLQPVTIKVTTTKELIS